jgi:mRNA interferase MazF
MTELAPQGGEIGWIEFGERAGHEQSGRRPALVLTPEDWNRDRGLAFVCPITSRPRGYASEVAIERGGIRGVAQTDQVMAVDWRARNWRSAGEVDESAWSEAVNRLMVIVDPLRRVRDL